MKRLSIFMLLALSWGCGKTVFKTERFACDGTGDCADGFVCSAGECRTSETVDAGMNDSDAGSLTDGGSTRDGGSRADAGAGGGCSSTDDCQSAHTCVDGVCCRTACGQPCDSCAQPGFEGTCLPSPLGTAVSACAGYACDGTTSACSTACTVDAGVNACSPGYTCVSATCGRCWSSARADFNLANDPAWVLGGADIMGGLLNIPVMSRNGMSSEATATSFETLPLVGCGVTIELATAPSVVEGYEARLGLRAAVVAARPSFNWLIDTRGVVATWAFADGGVGEQVVVPAGTTPPRWLRIEESGGQVSWRATSATTFTTLHVLPHGESLTGMKVEFGGRFPAQPGSQRVSYSVGSINGGP